MPGTDTNGVTFVTDKNEKKQFLDFPYSHYSDDHYWVPPLKLEQKKLLNTKKNPFFNNAEIALFLAYHNNRPAGRIAAIIDHRYNKYHNEKTGFFGFFEVINNQETANLLFRVAEDWLKDKGMKRVLGPTNPSMMDPVGILVDGFDKYPAIMMPYNKEYYKEILTAAGYEKEVDLYSYYVSQETVNRERVNRAEAIVKRRVSGLNIRPINLKNLKAEVEAIREIFNEAWKDNWGYIPLTEEEFDHFAADLKTIVDPDFTHMADINGKTVAFSIALPDYNQVFKKMDGTLFPFGLIKLLWNKRKINTTRTALMGVLPSYQGKGIDVLMHRETIENSFERDYKGSEIGWILENNTEMIRVAEKVGGVLEKTYRMYYKRL